YGLVIQHIAEFGTGWNAEFRVDNHDWNALIKNPPDRGSQGQRLDWRDYDSGQSSIDRLFNERNLRLRIIVPHGCIPVDVQADGARNGGSAGMLRLPKRCSASQRNDSNRQRGALTAGKAEDQERQCDQWR